MVKLEFCNDKGREFQMMGAATEKNCETRNLCGHGGIRKKRRRNMEGVNVGQRLAGRRGKEMEE